MIHLCKLVISLFINFILIETIPLKATAQSKFTLGLRFTGLAYHPKKSPHPYLYKARLDKNGHFVFNTGIAFVLGYYVCENLSIRYTQALLLNDCANKHAGMSQIGLNISCPIEKNQELNACFGPMFFYRKSWKNLPGYIDEHLFMQSVNGKSQYKFVWYGIYGDYNYAVSNNESITLSVLPGIPEIIAFAPGLTYRSKSYDLNK